MHCSTLERVAQVSHIPAQAGMKAQPAALSMEWRITLR